MTEKEEVVGYYTDDGNIYCVECINKSSGILGKIDQTITADDSEEGVYFCDLCENRVK